MLDKGQTLYWKTVTQTVSEQQKQSSEVEDLRKLSCFKIIAKLNEADYYLTINVGLQRRIKELIKELINTKNLLYDQRKYLWIEK